MIIDSHVHLVPPDRERYPLRPVPPSQRRPGRDPAAVADAWELGADSLLDLIGRSGAQRAVLVHMYPLYAYDCSAIVDAALAQPDRFRAVVQVDPFAADQAERLAELAATKVVSGVRLRLLYEPELLTAAGRPAWEACRDLGLTVEALVTDYAGLAPVIARVAPLPVVLHGGVTAELMELAAGRRGRVIDELLELPNCHVKLSTTALRAFAESGGGAGAVAALTAAFGPERVVWGSDFPQAVAGQTYADLVVLALDSLSSLSARDRDLVLAANAARLWGW